jgi:uncharacterized protein (TIGR03437 family)
MNRIAIFAFLSLTGLCLQAQSLSSVTISTDPTGARFTVDGQIYFGAANFVWPAGSKHTLVFLTDPTLDTDPPNTHLQTGLLGDTQYIFSGWQDNASLITPTADPIQIITADPHITTIIAKLTVAYRITLNYFKSLDPSLPPACGAPGAIPAGQFRPGIVFVGTLCFWSSADIFVPANTSVILNAFPYPGFVFLGWTFQNGFSPDYLLSIRVTGPTIVAPRFTPAQHVEFVTSPPGLSLVIDRTTVPTRLNGDVNEPCIDTQPVPAQTGFPSICRGDFDFAPGSSHLINSITQYDTKGVSWVYDSWSGTSGLSGQGQSPYLAGSSSVSDVVTVKFVRGAQVSFLTSPTGLNLTVDGRSNNPSLNFVWGQGTTHTISAVASQTDKSGRQYSFKSWSNGAAPSQSFTVDQSAVDNGYRITAAYSVLSRVIVASFPSGIAVQVDGKTCTTPCTIDRANGSQLRVTAPTNIPLGDSARMDLLSWSDNGTADHTFTVNTDYSLVNATYRTSYRLSVASDPGNGVAFQVDPASPDMFYPQDTPVNITATPNAGFKFRRWNGDLAGTYPAGALTMSSAHSVLALMDRIPFIAPAGVKNAVGDTPTSAVAPGSIITVFGQSLAPVLQVGRVNPLAQSIAGVTVTVADRILPLLYVSPEQINAVVPSDLPSGDYTLQVHSQGQPDVSGSFSVIRNAPGLFTQTIDGQTYAMAYHADGSPVNGDSPAKAGETVSLLGTGFGPYTGFILDGFFPPTPAPALADSLTISTADQTPATVWAGAAPGYSGVALVKFKVPDGMAGGTAVSVTVSVNGNSSNTVMLPLL